MPSVSVSISVVEKGANKPQYTIDSDIGGAVTLADLLKFTKTALIVISSDVLKEEQALGFDKQPLVIVDGNFNKPVDSVNPLGKISFVARQDLREIILYAFEEISKRQKVKTGFYKLGNSSVFYNGKEVAQSEAGIKAWIASNPPFSDKDKIRFVNIAPYARKLERFGITATSTRARIQRTTRKTRKGSKTNQVPSGAYALAAKAIKRKYGKNSFIKYEPILGSHLGLTGAGREYMTGKTIGRPYLYPTILIYSVAKGLQ